MHWAGHAFLLVAEATTQVFLGIRYGYNGRETTLGLSFKGFVSKRMSGVENSNKELGYMKPRLPKSVGDHSWKTPEEALWKTNK